MTDYDCLFSTTGKVAVVTGGTSGIGYACARALMRSGARVLIVARKPDPCHAAAAALNALGLPGTAVPVVGDVGTEGSVTALLDRIGAVTDRVDILVNNAGKTWGARLETFPYGAWESVMAVNLFGPFALLQGLLSRLRAAGTADDPARVINIGSMIGNQPLSQSAYSYATSKAALHHLTRILAGELAASHVTVNAIAPGMIESRMTAFVVNDTGRQARLNAKIPLGRMGRGEDIEGVVHLLCGAAGCYITGAVLPVDGGLGLLPVTDLLA